MKPSRLLSLVMRLASIPDLKDVDFSYTEKNMEKAGKGPWFILMNHSSFLDFEIASKLLFPKRYHIVATSDGFVGKDFLMRALGCIPTKKFVTDLTLISDIRYALEVNRTSVLMYPEASYSFDGTTTPLPRKLGVLLKSLNVPVVMITTYGSFTRDPLYNNLQKRKVKVSATIECLLSPSEIQQKSVPEMDAILDRAFDLDYFRWQKEEGVEVSEPFRADGLHRILYHCPHCGSEGTMEGRGTTIRCNSCGKMYEMDVLGCISAIEGKTEFSHIPDWYQWERSLIREAVMDQSYCMDTRVKVGMMVDHKAIYMVGEGTLHHDINGFVLDACDGALHYEQGPLTCYSVYSDYFWYEIGDIVCIGNNDVLYYCFPAAKDVVTKVRIAVEEIYKYHKLRRAGAQ